MKAILLLAIMHIMIAYQSEKRNNNPVKKTVIKTAVLPQPDKATSFSGFSYGFTWHIQNNITGHLPQRSWNYTYGSRL